MATTDGTSADTARSESSELEAPDDPEEAFALYDQCLQDHGVDPGEGFVVAGEGDAIAVAPPRAGHAGDGDGARQPGVRLRRGRRTANSRREIDEEMLAAMEACRGHLANATPEFDLTPEQQAAMEDAQLAFQQCMEEHGIEGGGFTIAIGDGPGSTSTSSRTTTGGPATGRDRPRGVPGRGRGVPVGVRRLSGARRRVPRRRSDGWRVGRAAPRPGGS